MKKLGMSQLLGGRTLGLLCNVRSEEITRFIELMLRKANANEAVDVGGELIRLANNVVSRMTMGGKCCNDKKEADEVRKLVKSVAELTEKFNLAYFIRFCKSLGLQGFGKMLKDVRDTFDAMMERIIKEHEEARNITKETDDEHKDILDILLDISGDESSEFKLIKENINAFILVIY